MRILVCALAWSLCAAASAQGLHKCRDAAGKVTYASQECEVLGLKPAGEIQNRSSVAPAYKPPPKPAAKPADKADAKAVAKPAAGKDTVEPDKAREPGERRCFKTAQGTRCNDEPEPNDNKR
jgi:uncharacterized protein DUF4124